MCRRFVPKVSTGPIESVLAHCVKFESSRMPMLMPCPNGTEGRTSPNPDKLIPHPSADSPDSLDSFYLIGLLFDVVIWTSLRLDLHMSRSFWKILVGQVRET
jgi:hypothetical protein